MKKRKMSALQRKYFGKRHKTVHRTKVVNVAKRKSSKRYTSRRGGGGRGMFGGMKGMLFPIAAGAIDHYANGMLPVQGVGATVVGFVGHNETLKTLGLYQIGGSIPDLIPGIGIGGGSKAGGLL